MSKSSKHLIALPSAPQEVSESYSATDEEISQAITRAQENLLRQQKPDGHWCGELIVDSTLCSDYILFMHWCGEVDAQMQRRCVRHILRRQLPDGGWNIYHGGPSEINASAKAYFALKLAGCSVDAPFMQEARANIIRRGGIPQMNTFSKLYLALLGQFPWKYLPAIPVEMVLLPSWAPFHIHKMSSWSRAMLMPLAIINHFKPTRILPGEKQSSRAICVCLAASVSGHGGISFCDSMTYSNFCALFRFGRCGSARLRKRSGGCCSESVKAAMALRRYFRRC